MNKDIKQIYAALQVGEKDIRLLVAEYFNTRFNILKSEKISSASIADFHVNDKELVKKEITTLLEKTSAKLGAKIEKVILVLPAYNFRRYPLKSTVVPSEEYVSKKDIARAVSNSLNSPVDDDALIANAALIKYTINGISSRRLPEKEACDELVVDIDLLCCDKQMAYDLVTVVESCGISILDICLNSYAICKEAALFEESLKQNLILLDINEQVTYLSLLSKGKLISTETIFDGLDSIAKGLETYKVPNENVYKLLKYDVDFNGEYPDDVVFAFNQNDQAVTLTLKQLNDAVEKPLTAYVDKVLTMCNPILEAGPTQIVITGSGEEMKSLVEMFKQKTSVEVRKYFPDTIGVRDSQMSAIYGSLFVYREKAHMNSLSVNCIDQLQYDNVIDHRSIDVEGESLTTKIKNLFAQYMSKED